MADVLSPFVYWGQNTEKVFLKVDLKDVTNPEVDLTDEHLHLKARGQGMRGLNDYYLKMNFYLPVDPNSSKFRVTDRCIEFQIEKVGKNEYWPRPMYGPKKPAWLKIDFDHFSFDDSEEEQQDATAEEEMLANLEKELNMAEGSAFRDMKTFYLFVYNMFMWIGYSYVFIVLNFRYYRDGEASKKDAYDAVGAQLMVCQLAAILEVLHPAVGLVKSSPMMPLLQVFGRNLILFGLLAQEPKLQEREIVWWLFVTWAAVELIRYPYYMLSVVDLDWKVITWLRYTVWIPLYPLGFVFEGFVMLLSLPYFEQTGRWSVSLPNAANMSLHFPSVLRVYMLLFLPGMYMLMKRMYEQRKVKIKPTQPSHRMRKRSKAE